MKSAQVWSMDIMIAVIIFIGTIFVVYIALSGNEEAKVNSLENEAEHVMKSVTSEDPDLGIVEGSELDKDKIDNLLNRPYSELKSELRIDNEFCIYLEDENGNLIEIQPGQVGIGSSDIFIGETPVPCG